MLSTIKPWKIKIDDMQIKFLRLVRNSTKSLGIFLEFLFLDPIEVILIHDNKQHIKNEFRNQPMSREAQRNARKCLTQSNFQKPTSFIKNYSAADDDGRKDVSFTTSQLNHILQPKSIFKEDNSQPVFDTYLKIKIKDKPKDSLREIQHKKESFLDYVNQNQKANQISSNKIGRSKQQFTQNTFSKRIQQNSVMVVRVVPTKPHKCNISLVNMLGEVIKYFPNILTSKKQGKIMKIISQFATVFLIVFDYTKIQQTILTFPALVSQLQYLYYQIVNLPCDLERGKIHQIKQKIFLNSSAVMESSEGNLILSTNNVLKLRSQGILEAILTQISKNNTQESQFLIKIRGQKDQEEFNLAFDMMMVNLWRQFGWENKKITDKIIQLFNNKEKYIKSMIVEEDNLEHIPKRMKISKNCVFCISNRSNQGRPKRTIWVCPSCSYKEKKLFFLCKSCFKSYHRCSDFFVSNKKQKKTRKLKGLTHRNKKISKNSNILSKRNKKKEAQKDEQNKSDEILLLIDKHCSEYFGKIDELIEEGKLSSAQLYLQMMLNIAITKNQEFLDKLNQEQTQQKLMMNI